MTQQRADYPLDHGTTGASARDAAQQFKSFV
jgi:hypothetical protein